MGESYVDELEQGTLPFSILPSSSTLGRTRKEEADTLPASHLRHRVDLSQVQQFQDVATRLQTAYAGEKADAIQSKEQEVSAAWQALLDACAGRRAQLVDTADKFRFFSMVRDLLSWMDSIIRQIETQERPR